MKARIAAIVVGIIVVVFDASESSYSLVTVIFVLNAFLPLFNFILL